MSRFADLVVTGRKLTPSEVDTAVRRALDEDLGQGGDITSAATIPADRTTAARLVARKPGVIAGLVCAEAAFRLIDPKIDFAGKERDGIPVAAGTLLAEIAGSARAILGAERTALNFLGHLSGVATLTAAYVTQVAHTTAKITCTRKTTPGLRALEKYAVRCGGGTNHRMGLFDAVLIKDNHRAIAGGVRAALTSARAAVGSEVKIEIEVDSLDQLREVLATGLADAVLLDNMDMETLSEAVRLADGKVELEASGGILLENVAHVAETGVDFISVGALTHSAPSLDVALDIDS